MDNALSSSPTIPATLVVGGGIGGMRAALDLADAGLKVYLVEHSPSLGGRVAQLGFMFPQHDCLLCRGTPDHGFGCTRPSLSPAFLPHNQHPNIDIMTNTQVIDVQGQAGNFTVALHQGAQYIDSARCINCDHCTQVCPVTLPDAFQQGFSTRKAIYKVAARAAPDSYVIDRGPYCDECRRCADVCPTDAIDLDRQAQHLSIQVGAVILALGFQNFEAGRLEEFGHGRYANVIDALQYERLASRSGPTEGLVIRPSDGKRPQSIAWLQCIGSRDQANAYCSSICCMVATKEAMLAKQRLGSDVQCTVFIMDERAFNKEYSTYFDKARVKHDINYQRCRVSEIRQDPTNSDLILHHASADGQLQQERFQLVVLATGMQPPNSARHFKEILDIKLNEHGFCQTHKFNPLQTTRPGVFVCGAFSSPKEISETILEAGGAAAEVMRLLGSQLNTYPYNREWPFLPSMPISDIATSILPPERDVSAEVPRLGIFACTCADTISQVLDLNQLIHEAAKWPSVTSAEVIDVACFPNTLKHIEKIIKKKALNRVIIAGCSNRSHLSLFQRTVRQAGLNPYLMELVNLREQCSRVHQKQPHLANFKAVELVRMAVGRLLQAQPIHKKQQESIPRALIIGGGLAGLTSALAVADAGHEVILVERSPKLGGQLQNIHYVVEGEDPRRFARDLISRMNAHPRVTVHLQTELIAHGGQAGQFWAQLRTTSGDDSISSKRITHGAVIVATGGCESRAHPWLHLPGVITQEELEQKVAFEVQEIAALKDVVMVQCVPQPGTVPYCSRICCTNTIKNAIRIKQVNPHCRVTILYKNMVTYGFREKYYTEARRLGILFIRYTGDQMPHILPAPPDSLVVHARDLSLDRMFELPADIVALSTPIAPSPGTRDLAQLLGLPLSDQGFFSEAQIKLRPMDFQRDGLFLAGMAHYPKFIEETISHALAAAARTITLLSQDKTYFGDLIAEVNPQLCVGCLTCMRVCPYAIPQIIQVEGRAGVGNLGGAAYIDPAQCHGCGTCTAECPANAIQLANYHDRQIMLQEIGGLGSRLN